MLRPHELANILLNLFGESFWGLAMALVTPATVPAIILRHWGAGLEMIGSIAAVEGGGLLALQAISPYLFHSRRKRQRHMIIYHLLVILPLLAALGLLTTPLVPVDAQVRCWLVLAAFGLCIASIGMIAPVWFDWLAHIFRTEIRGRTMGLGFGGAAMAALGGTLLASWMLGCLPAPEVYGWLYGLCLLMATISVAMFILIRDPAAYADSSLEAEASPPSPGQMLGFFVRSLSDRNFAHFLAARALCIAGFCVGPLVAMRFMSAEGGSLGEAQLVAFSAAQAVASAFAQPLVGWLGDRRGHRWGLLAGAVAQAVVMALLLTTSGGGSCLAVYTAMGLAGGATFIAQQNILLETCPHEHRPAHLAMGNVALSAVAIAAPLAAADAAARWGLWWVFLACGTCSAAGAVWVAVFFRDPRHTPPQPTHLAAQPA
jgi:MFS family permease